MTRASGDIESFAQASAADEEAAFTEAYDKALVRVFAGYGTWAQNSEEYREGLRRFARHFAAALLSQSAAPADGRATFTFELQPMDEIGQRFAQEVMIHEGTAAVILGTNAKAIGWIDPYETFKGRVYRHHLLPAPPLPQSPAMGVGEALARCEVTNNPCGTDTWVVGRPCQCRACQTYLANKQEPQS